MTKPRVTPMDPMPMLAPLPGWIVAMASDTPELAAFKSGAALAHLSCVTAADPVPQGLWRDRLALEAAEVSAGIAGRREGAGALRDALHLTKAGDDAGPAGNILRQWSRAVARPISVGHLAKALEGGAREGVAPERIAMRLDTSGPTPVDRAAQVIEAVLEGNPRGEIAALILADAVLSLALGRDHLLPLLGPVMTARDLRLRGCDLRLCCHRAAVKGVGKALPLAGTLARGAVRLRAAVPQLRAKGAGQAVEIFLSQDAVAPAAMTFLSDRAARRLCDRLVSLGAISELTGRDTFRLYGL